MSESTKKNIALTGAAIIILCAAAGTSAMYSNNNNDMRITDTASLYITDYPSASCSTTEGTTTESSATAAKTTADIVYVSSSGKYHSKSDCSGMKHYTEMTLDEVIDAEYSPCGRCFLGIITENTKISSDTVTPETSGTSSEAIVYVSSSGKYHVKSDCSGMKRYTEMEISEAVDAGYTACKKCAASDDD